MTSQDEGTASPTGGAGPEDTSAQLPVTARRTGKAARLDQMTAEWDAVHERGSE